MAMHPIKSASGSSHEAQAPWVKGMVPVPGEQRLLTGPQLLQVPSVPKADVDDVMQRVNEMAASGDPKGGCRSKPLVGVVCCVLVCVVCCVFAITKHVEFVFVYFFRSTVSAAGCPHY